MATSLSDLAYNFVAHGHGIGKNDVKDFDEKEVFNGYWANQDCKTYGPGVKTIYALYHNAITIRQFMEYYKIENIDKPDDKNGVLGNMFEGYVNYPLGIAYKTNDANKAIWKSAHGICCGRDIPCVTVTGVLNGYKNDIPNWLKIEGSVVDASFPHTCPKCKGPAYLGLMTVDCKMKCS